MAVENFFDELQEIYSINVLEDYEELQDHITMQFKFLNYSQYSTDLTYQIGQSLKMISKLGSKVLHVPIGIKNGTLPHNKEKWFP